MEVGKLSLRKLLINTSLKWNEKSFQSISLILTSFTISPAKFVPTTEAYSAIYIYNVKYNYFGTLFSSAVLIKETNFNNI